MDFIFMLTRADRTIPDCMAVIEEIRPLGLKHIGFKDVGADWQTQRRLRASIEAMGALCYLEVVSTDPRSCLRSAARARRLGVDRLLGGTDVAATMDILGGSGIAYYPFPGSPKGHPTVLLGTAEAIAADCSRMLAAGAVGVDLLAYRAVEAQPLDLIRAARAALGGHPLIVAGSIDSPARIAAIADAGADAFTVGSAALEGAFAPARKGLAAQLEAIQDAASRAGQGLALPPDSR